MGTRYKLAVGAMCRNESHGLEEWLTHYRIRGVDHFYIIDDASNDGSRELLHAQATAHGDVTVFEADWGRYLGRQRDMYNEYLLPVLTQANWFLVVDLDEYMWSPRGLSLASVLEASCSGIGQIQVGWTNYGSNGHTTQPRSLVEGFTRRTTSQPTTPNGGRKYFIQTACFNFTSLNLHHATFADLADETNGHFLFLGPDDFILNHYICQSRDFWVMVKCTRGDGDHYRVRGLADFDEVDLNEVEDLSLLSQACTNEVR